LYIVKGLLPLRKTSENAAIAFTAGLPPQQVLSNGNIKIKYRKAKL